jgi:hypothetical protein
MLGVFWHGIELIDVPCRASCVASGQLEVQSVQCTLSSGTFNLAFKYSMTDNLAVTATASQVQAALQDLPTYAALGAARLLSAYPTVFAPPVVPHGCGVVIRVHTAPRECCCRGALHCTHRSCSTHTPPCTAPTSAVSRVRSRALCTRDDTCVRVLSVPQAVAGDCQLRGHDDAGVRCRSGCVLVPASLLRCHRDTSRCSFDASRVPRYVPSELR